MVGSEHQKRCVGVLLTSTPFLFYFVYCFIPLLDSFLHPQSAASNLFISFINWFPASQPLSGDRVQSTVRQS